MFRYKIFLKCVFYYALSLICINLSAQIKNKINKNSSSTKKVKSKTIQSLTKTSQHKRVIKKNIANPASQVIQSKTKPIGLLKSKSSHTTLNKPLSKKIIISKTKHINTFPALPKINPFADLAKIKKTDSLQHRSFFINFIYGFDIDNAYFDKNYLGIYIGYLSKNNFGFYLSYKQHLDYNFSYNYTFNDLEIYDNNNEYLGIGYRINEEKLYKKQEFSAGLMAPIYSMKQIDCIGYVGANFANQIVETTIQETIQNSLLTTKNVNLSQEKKIGIEGGLLVKWKFLNLNLGASLFDMQKTKSVTYHAGIGFNYKL